MRQIERSHNECSFYAAKLVINCKNAFRDLIICDQ